MRRISLNCLALDCERPIGVENYVKSVMSEVNISDLLITCYTRSNVSGLSKIFEKPFISRHHNLIQKKMSVGSTITRILIEMLLLPVFTWDDDLVFSVNNFGPLWGKRGQIRLNLVHDVWFMSDGYKGGMVAKWIFRMLLTMQIFMDARIITVSEFSKREINKYFRVPLDNIEIVSGCLGKRPKILKHETSKENQYLLMIGSDRLNKNIWRGIEGYCIFRELNPEINLKLRIIGKYASNYISEVLEKYEKFGMDIEFMGYISDEELENLYQKSLGTIFPSLYEGFGIPAVESIARAKPILVSEETACAEIVGKLGVIVNAKDSQAIASGIQDLLGNSIDVDSLCFKEFSEKYLDCIQQSRKLSNLICRSS